MAYLVLGYGVHFEEQEKFVQEHSELIKTIRAANKGKDWKDKIIVGVGGGNWDLSYFIGFSIDVMEYTSISLTELNKKFLKQDYKTLFEERLATYPELQTALKPYEEHFGFQIVVDNE